MEIEKIHQQFPNIHPKLVNELYRKFKKKLIDTDSSDFLDNKKANLAVAFGNLLANDPESVTEFHFNQLEKNFTSIELIDLYHLYEILLNTKIKRSISPISI